MDVSRTRARALRAVVRLAVPACCVVLAAGCTAPDAPAGRDTPATAPAGVRAAVPRAANDLQDQYQRVIKEVLPSVVQIQARRDLGSGVVYDGNGHIVTNAHVVGSEKTFQVTTANSEDPLTASLVYSYPEQDLAVIRLDRVPDGLKPAVFGDSEKVQVGQIVLAMGSPLGLSSSVTQGIVSATGRTVSEGSTEGGTGATIPNMVQTSAAINPGNSGGALVDLDGQVIGIPTLAATDPSFGGSAAPGIGFAIPASMVKTVADQIVKEGKVVDSGRAALDITARTVVDDRYQPSGVAVVTVSPGGAADKAGLRPGDIITALGDQPITTITSLAEALAADRPGQRTSVTYQRNGTEKTVEVTLGEQ
ncbi:MULTISPECIES: S1C family serine protease [Streptomyces]|uniref:Trypsin-like peptidase domain-containing protein n=2 Tax=Streptomyces TaxID=1883 RepID=A0ABS9JMA1_9ACTN|nr:MULTISPECIES: trypsin-like peptidase domain-containing protein [Streptomyces]MCE0447955.1 trypsin-like peptidase domain-containing protein [Streptomyces tricolor]MCG0066697.1 trypsin-like peptidase domain-containing protein [Streptomyces tricolor]OYP18033.1 signal protein PDZ [Streptomyces sp. FBKL.4005]CUW27968.1 Serine protease Do-like HtrA [Streptomyces reticuli]